jgi:hypothetical protein
MVVELLLHATAVNAAANAMTATMKSLMIPSLKRRV